MISSKTADEISQNASFNCQSLYQIRIYTLFVQQPPSLPFPKQSSYVHNLLLTVVQ